MKYTIHTSTVEETQTIAAKLGSIAKRGDVFVFEGDLGVGKTTFTQGLAKGLRVKSTEYVSSPTFVIAKEYTTGRIPLYHLDLYRIDTLPELGTIGLEDYMESDGVCVIEWGNKVEDLLPDHYLYITMSIKGETKRAIQFKSSAVRYTSVIESLKEQV